MEKIIIYKEKGYILKIQIEKNKNNKRNYIKFDDIFINNNQIKKPKEIKKIEVEINEKKDNKDKKENEGIATAGKSNDLESSNNNMKNDCDNDIIKLNNIQINENYEGNIESNNNKSKN